MLASSSFNNKHFFAFVVQWNMVLLCKMRLMYFTVTYFAHEKWFVNIKFDLRNKVHQLFLVWFSHSKTLINNIRIRFDINIQICNINYSENTKKPTLNPIPLLIYAANISQTIKISSVKKKFLHTHSNTSAQCSHNLYCVLFFYIVFNNQQFTTPINPSFAFIVVLREAVLLLPSLL